jgi:acyl-CoA thioesterase-1
VSGDTAAQGRQRLAWTLQGLKQPPQLAIVALGANDMLRGLPPQQTARSSTRSSRSSRGATCGCSCRAWSRRRIWARITPRLQPHLSELAQKHGAALQPFFLEAWRATARSTSRTGIHPNLAGVKRMVLAIATR